MRLTSHASTLRRHVSPRTFLTISLRRQQQQELAASVPSVDIETETIDKIPHELLSYHWDTTRPQPSDLQRANTFFQRSPPSVLYTASQLFQVPGSSALPEVAFLGRSNVGKSTLLNALLGASICRTSSKPGRTRALHAYAVGGRDDGAGTPGRLAVLDMPGYGHGSQASWGATVSRYLARRKQLRRAFVLVDALHGVKERDALMLAQLREHGVPHQVVLSKVDRVLLPQRSTGRSLRKTTLMRNAESLRELVDAVRAASQPRPGPGPGSGPAAGVPALGEILCVSADLGRFRALADGPSATIGVEALRWSVLMATGFAGVGQRGQRVKTADAPVLIDHDR